VRRAAAFLLTAAVLSFAAAPASAGEASQRFLALAEGAAQQAPILRIGLKADHQVTIWSEGPFRIIDPLSGEPVWKSSYAGKIHVLAEGGPAEGAPSVFRVQVGAFGEREVAEREKQRLEKLAGAAGVVHHDPDRGNWRVRLGRADDRERLAPLMDKLRAAGIQGLWIAEEPAQVLTDVRLRLFDDSFENRITELARLAVVPASRHPIAVGEASYRGVVELSISPFGTVRPINWIGLERYLQGVVPAELGPEVWPQLQALQAQAVAARTYAWRNLGQFSDEGFDLCATPRCQVYKGVEAEHPLSNRAVWNTRGQILTWEDEPIVALYTATCGGHTEDGREVFPEHAEPYLKGVPCRAEGEALATQRGVIPGRRVQPLQDETGAEVTRDWALLAAAGVVGPFPDPGQAARAVEPAHLRSWTRVLCDLAGRPTPRGEAGPTATLGEAAATLLADLGWSERAEVLLSAEDLPALLRDPEASGLGLGHRRALAYLASVEGLQPFADGRLHPERPPTWARLGPALVRIGESYAAFGLRSAVVSGMGQGSIRMFQGKGKIRLPVGADAFLFSRTGGKPVPVTELEIWPGDRVRFRTAREGAIDFLELLPPVKGVSDDRTAKVYSWEVRRTRRQIEAAINRRVSVGRLKDLEVSRRGVSGRVVELKVVGSKASTVVRGFDVRRLLDLRESLLVIEIQRDERERIEAVVFAGKGWGHGVGLCQVGAYGMAIRGADYREILAHYYTGAKLEPLTPGDP
jgi:stage II sporulation protein D